MPSLPTSSLVRYDETLHPGASQLRGPHSIAIPLATIHPRLAGLPLEQRRRNPNSVCRAPHSGQPRLTKLVEAMELFTVMVLFGQAWGCIRAWFSDDHCRATLLAHSS